MGQRIFEFAKRMAQKVSIRLPKNLYKNRALKFKSFIFIITYYFIMVFVFISVHLASQNYSFTRVSLENNYIKNSLISITMSLRK